MQITRCNDNEDMGQEWIVCWMNMEDTDQWRKHTQNDDTTNKWQALSKKDANNVYICHKHNWTSIASDAVMAIQYVLQTDISFKINDRSQRQADFLSGK